MGGTRPLTSAGTLDVSGQITWSSRNMASTRNGSAASRASAGTIRLTNVYNCRVGTPKRAPQPSRGCGVGPAAGASRSCPIVFYCAFLFFFILHF